MNFILSISLKIILFIGDSKNIIILFDLKNDASKFTRYLKTLITGKSVKIRHSPATVSRTLFAYATRKGKAQIEVDGKSGYLF